MNRNAFLVVSYCIPTRTTGTPVVVRKFLENFSPEEVVLIGRPVKRSNAVKGYSIHYRTFRLPTPSVGARGERLWRLLGAFLGVLVGIRVIRSERLDAIVAFYRDESSLLTGYLLHKITGKPFYPYFCDLYLENYPKGVYHHLAKLLQPRVFQSATRVFVLTEAMKEWYQSAYGVDAVVLPHCVNEPATLINQTNGHTDGNGKMRIAHLGSVNDDRIPSLRVLCEAIQGDERYELTYFTSQSPEYLQEVGIAPANSTTRFIPDDGQLREELENCDILFLPATVSALQQHREAQVVTGFPTKAIEYLSVQKPILVHSESKYFVARFFRERACGYVVEGDAGRLRQALRDIGTDAVLRANLAKKAYSATAYFSGATIARRFREVLAHAKGSKRG